MQSQICGFPLRVGSGLGKPRMTASLGSSYHIGQEESHSGSWLVSSWGSSVVLGPSTEALS